MAVILVKFWYCCSACFVLHYSSQSVYWTFERGLQYVHCPHSPVIWTLVLLSQWRTVFSAAILNISLFKIGHVPVPAPALCYRLQFSIVYRYGTYRKDFITYFIKKFQCKQPEQVSVNGLFSNYTKLICQLFFESCCIFSVSLYFVFTKRLGSKRWSQIRIHRVKLRNEFRNL